MDFLNWELHILKQAVACKNISLAAQHIGLSQPQISRIIQKIEQHHGILLLDRTSKRNSEWTEQAVRIVEIYNRLEQKFFADLSQLKPSAVPERINIGILEGLVHIALQFVKNIFEKTSVHVIELDIFDLADLEKKFLQDEFDLLFSFREPGYKKYPYSHVLGYQTLDTVSKRGHYHIQSSFEFAISKQKSSTAKTKTFISNSLMVRKLWLDLFGGSAIIPSDVKRHKSSSDTTKPVLLIGNNRLSKSFWQELTRKSLI